MSFDLKELLEQRHGENFQLHAQYLNPQLAKVVKTLGFDRFYEHGEGCYLYDDDGKRYLDLLSGFGVFALGRSHPSIKDALHQALDADLPNMVQMDCALLPGLLAEQLVQRSPSNIERVFFCQLRRRSSGGGHQVRPREDRSLDAILLSRARLSRAHHRGALAQRLGGVQEADSARYCPAPRRFPSATSTR